MKALTEINKNIKNIAESLIVLGRHIMQEKKQ